MKNRSERKAGALLSYVNLAISSVVPLLYTPVMLRILGQAEYGLYSLSNSIISYLTLLTLGIGNAIIRYLMMYRTTGNKEMCERMVGLFLTIYSVIAMTAFLIGISITRFSGEMFAQGLYPEEIRRLNTLIVIMSFSTAVSFISSVFSSVITCYERYIFQRVLALVGTVAIPLLNLAALYAGFASVGMALASTFVHGGTCVLNALYCIRKLEIRPRFRNLPVHMLKELFGFSVFVLLSAIADMLYWATDKVLIGAMLGSTAVAVYNVGATFNAILQSLSSSISSVFAPRANQLVFSNSPISESSDLLIRVGRIQYLIVSLVLSGFVAFGRPFIRLWAGEAYLEAYTVALMTMIPLAIPLIQNIAFATITAMNRHQFRAVLYIVLAVCNVIGTYFLMPVMGIVGAALCTCVVFVLGNGIAINIFYYKKIGLDIPRFWKNILHMTMVPGAMTLVFLAAQRCGVSFDALHSFASGVLVYTLVFCGLSWLFSMNRYEKDLIRSLFQKVLRRWR